MISLICKLLLKLCDKLPESPLSTASDGFEYISDMMGYLNFFIPFKACSVILGSWCAAMALYYVYKTSKDTLTNFLP